MRITSSSRFLVVVIALTAMIAASKVFARESKKDCATCKGQIVGVPDMAPIKSLASLSSKLSTTETSSKDSYQQAFCNQFEMAQDTVDVETMFEDMEGSPYKSSVNEFWTTPACRAPLKNDTPVPIAFNTASNPAKSEFFPKTIHDYFVDEKKDPQTWIKAINTKTSDGLTFLDFLQYNIQRGFYSVKSDKDAALRVVSYICKNGGIYSKYKDTAKCP